ncbi:hypothetical protein SAMN05421748_12499 [Paractinoplanes atraurantiacus]|uniref:Uncharacterized protein n=1 Tax=Paractinoplanes atraurantiacus TaxID=1036182 RepID=A0A285JRK5_9ACTN|nr:hypothetical protein SAMN05421748_12499 [Actinoplanes atraurantiacus]
MNKKEFLPYVAVIVLAVALGILLFMFLQVLSDSNSGSVT